MVCVFKIPGNPIAKKRPRFATMKRGNKSFSMAYNSQKTEEGRVLFEFQKHPGRGIMKGPLFAFFKFYVSRPKSHFGTGRNEGRLKKSAPLYHIIKPDVDNLVKFYLDVMEGEVFENDKQVISVTAFKFYTEEDPFTEIVLQDANDHSVCLSQTFLFFLNDVNKGLDRKGDRDE
jgi:Holliday junction resolvase RusA-like endonuclease